MAAEQSVILCDRASVMADRVRRLWALVVAARDLASTVSSRDPNLGHTQELLAAADEAGHAILADAEALHDSLLADSHEITVPTRAA